MTEFSSAGADASRWEEEDGGDSRPRQGRVRQGAAINYQNAVVHLYHYIYILSFSTIIKYGSSTLYNIVRCTQVVNKLVFATAF